jgi:predicted dehydrogenase
MKKQSRPKPTHALDVNRRDFLRGSSFATLMMMLGGVEITSANSEKKEAAAGEKQPGPPVQMGVIGLGAWGREIVSTLSRLPNAPVVAVCDNYAASLRRGGEAAPNAARHADYRQLLEQKEVQAVIVATPTHLHKEIVLAALQAGKHVYCEAPLAHTMEDARAIATAARQTSGVIFQSGQLYRSNPQHHHVFAFFRSNAIGRTSLARAQYHSKQSWRKASPNPEREQALNWRLDPAISPGLMGEVGVQHLDVANWYLNALPVAVTGFGGVLHWDDGRTVPDTVQAIVEYPNGMNLVYDATLTNSFDGSYEMYYGHDAAIMIRESKAWMFKEVDSPLLGWEVYARKEEFFGETGIALVANATKLLAQGKKPAEGASDSDTPIFYAMEDFVSNINEKKAPHAGYKEGFQAAVTGLVANQAVVKKQRIEYRKEWFQI